MYASFKVYVYSQLNMQWDKVDLYAEYDIEQKTITAAICCISAGHILANVIGYKLHKNCKLQ